MKEIPLTKGYVALVDDEDFERASRFKWCAATSRGSKTVYAKRATSILLGPKRTVYLHRFLLDAPDGFEVDHEDGNGLNCQRYNMRLATHAQNLKNLRLNAKNKSGHKGVHWNVLRQKWTAYITANYKRTHLGLFDNFDDAVQAYDEAAARLHGEFTRE